MIKSAYLSSVLTGDQIRDVVDYLQETLVEKRIKFDAIAFRGVSGALVAPALAVAMSKNLFVVRKHKVESAHTEGFIEGDDRAQRYLIVDDVIESGRTIFEIRDAVEKFNPKNKLAGVLFYGDYDFYKGVSRKLWTGWKKELKELREVDEQLAY